MTAKLHRYITTMALPVILAAGAATVLCLWAHREKKLIFDRTELEIRNEVMALTSALEGGISSQISGGKAHCQSLSSIMEGIITTTPLRFILIKQDNKTLLSAGTVPELAETDKNTGMILQDKMCTHWRTVRLQDSEKHRRGTGMGSGGGTGSGTGTGSGGGHGQRRKPAEETTTVYTDLDFGTSDQLLVVGMDATRHIKTRQNLLTRLWIDILLASILILIVLLAWFVSLRTRRLKEELRGAHMRASHLEEMGLAASGLAHETKNPLGIIRGLAQTISGDNSVPEDKREMAETIMEEVDTATDRLGNFSSFAKTHKPEMSIFNAKTFLNRTTDLLKPDCDEARVKIQVNSDDLMIKADTRMLQQVIVNLLLNSLKASSSGSTITVKLSGNHGVAQLSVIDQGEGIPNKIIRDIFKPYVSGRPDGHGLGLAITKRIVEDHNWTINVESNPGKGTRFNINGILFTRPTQEHGDGENDKV